MVCIGHAPLLHSAILLSLLAKLSCAQCSLGVANATVFRSFSIALPAACFFPSEKGRSNIEYTVSDATLGFVPHWLELDNSREDFGNGVLRTGVLYGTPSLDDAGFATIITIEATDVTNFRTAAGQVTVVVANVSGNATTYTNRYRLFYHNLALNMFVENLHQAELLSSLTAELGEVELVVTELQTLSDLGVLRTTLTGNEGLYMTVARPDGTELRAVKSVNDRQCSTTAKSNDTYSWCLDKVLRPAPPEAEPVRSGNGSDVEYIPVKYESKRLDRFSDFAETVIPSVVIATVLVLLLADVMFFHRQHSLFRRTTTVDAPPAVSRHRQIHKATIRLRHLPLPDGGQFDNPIYDQLDGFHDNPIYTRPDGSLQVGGHFDNPTYATYGQMRDNPLYRSPDEVELEHALPIRSASPESASSILQKIPGGSLPRVRARADRPDGAMEERRHMATPPPAYSFPAGVPSTGFMSFSNLSIDRRPAMALPNMRNTQEPPLALMARRHPSRAASDLTRALDHSRPPSYAPPAYKLPPTLGLGAPIESQQQHRDSRPVNVHERPRVKSLAPSTS